MDDRPTIHEIIVVEGRDDITAIKRAVRAEVISTGGFGFQCEALARIKAAHERRGIIVLTDPDAAGTWIRQKIIAEVGACKHAHVPRDQCTTRSGNVGIENASPTSIRTALAEAHASLAEVRFEFTIDDLFAHGLTAAPGATSRRRRLGESLGVGYGNARRLVSRLNYYGITRDEFNAALNAL